MSARARIGFLLACAGTIALYAPSAADSLAPASPGMPSPSDLATLDEIEPPQVPDGVVSRDTTSLAGRTMDEAGT